MFPKDEVKKKLENPNTLMRALEDSVEMFPGLQPSAIAQILLTYQSRLIEEFGVMD